MNIADMNANPNLPTVIACTERGMTCGSCRAHAQWVILTAGGKRWATTCARHRDLWIRRAAQA
jgi:hypothetical protein